MSGSLYRQADAENQYASITPPGGGTPRTPEYDQRGNLRYSDTSLNPAIGTIEYRHAWDNRLWLVRQWNGSAWNASPLLAFHDALGRRTESRVNGVWTQLIHDGERVVEERTGNHLDTATLARSYAFGDYLDEPVAMIDESVAGSGTTHYYLHDRRYSVVALVYDDNGATAVAESYAYTSFGLTTIYDDQGAVLTNGSALGNTTLFTGRRYDHGSQTYDYRARNYLPEIGRFLQRDPAGYIDGYNLYAYVGNNPLRFVDPSGLARQAPRSGGFGVGVPSITGPTGPVSNGPIDLTFNNNSIGQNFFAVNNAPGGYNVFNQYAGIGAASPIMDANSAIQAPIDTRLGSPHLSPTQQLAQTMANHGFTSYVYDPQIEANGRQLLNDFRRRNSVAATYGRAFAATVNAVLNPIGTIGAAGAHLVFGGSRPDIERVLYDSGGYASLALPGVIGPRLVGATGRTFLRGYRGVRSTFSAVRSARLFTRVRTGITRARGLVSSSSVFGRATAARRARAASGPGFIERQIAAIWRQPNSVRTVARGHVITGIRGGGDGLTSNLIGVPRAPLDRAVARLEGLKVGDKKLVQSIEAFGSRAGSRYRGRGPTPESDLDLLVTVTDARYFGGGARSQRFVEKTLAEISRDFRIESRIKLQIVPRTVNGRSHFISNTIKEEPVIKLR